ncbi:hypothetical protein H0X06_07090, partial [Candidatus Dependentiae bacterium]|nr:hypothetical protein [Candidatus Dependentiae bacterium]
MKKNILLSLVITTLCSQWTQGMDITSPTASTFETQLPTDIRISLPWYLIQVPTAQEAIKNLAALLSINKKFQLLLKENKHITRALIDYM